MHIDSFSSCSYDIKKEPVHNCNDGKFGLLSTFFFDELQYHKEVVRLMSGEFRQRIGERYIAFARKWMTYVLTKCESGRGTKPRYARFIILSL